jgi:aldose 1-epimerase
VGGTRARHRAAGVGHRAAPAPGYPFTLDVAISYALDGAGLTVATTATNLGDMPYPYGAGQHPYLAAGTEFIDSATVTLDAATWLPTDERGLPTGTEPVEGSPLDFRAGRVLGDRRIDYAFTDLARDADGRAWVRLDAPTGGARAVALRG